MDFGDDSQWLMEFDAVKETQKKSKQKGVGLCFRVELRQEDLCALLLDVPKLEPGYGKHQQKPESL